MLIFHRFPSIHRAAQFGRAIELRFGLEAVAVADWEEFNCYEVFPFELKFPAVLVDRPQPNLTAKATRIEDEIEHWVRGVRGGVCRHVTTKPTGPAAVV